MISWFHKLGAASGMRINTLRQMDYWVGRPICGILTIAYKVKKAFLKKGPIKDPKKILLIKLFGMGSIILAFPSINAVKRKYPNSSIYFLTFKGNDELLTLTGMVSEQKIFSVRVDNLFNFIMDTVRQLFILSRERIDVVIDLEFFSRFTAVLSFAIRSKYRIGFYGFHTEGLKRGSFIDFQVNYNHTLHTSQAFFTLLKPLGIYQEDFDPSIPRIPPTEKFRDKIMDMIKRCGGENRPELISQWIVINANASNLISLRRWPVEHFVALINRLLDHDDSLGILLIGEKNERSDVEALKKSCKPDKTSRIMNLAGMTGITDLVGLFHFSSLFITNDSGPAHLASLTDIPNVVLFGPETPDLYSPLGGKSKCLYLAMDCQPCVTVYNGKFSPCHNNVCLQRISPDSVFKLAIESLSASPFPRVPSSAEEV